MTNENRIWRLISRVSGSKPDSVEMARSWGPGWTRRQVKPRVPDILDGVRQLDWGWNWREWWGVGAGGFWMPGRSWPKRRISRNRDHGSGVVSDASGCQDGVGLGTSWLMWRFQASVFKAYETIYDPGRKRSRWTGHGTQADAIWGTRTVFRWGEIRAKLAGLRLIY